jgi:hypothetical protein
VLGVALVVLLVLPACSLVVKAALMLLERSVAGGPLRSLRLRYVLLIASSAVPLAWFFSAALHQIEPGTLARACLLDHEAASLCLEPASFAFLLAASVVLSSARRLRLGHGFTDSPSHAAEQLRARIARLLSARPSLASLRGRVVVTEQPGLDAATVGLLQPRVVVGVSFAAKLTDSMLAAALGHEREHVRALDPLRYLLLELALQVNPFGRWLLARHVARWTEAREAHCDREAVLSGAEPLPLAQALLRAARPEPAFAPALAPHTLAVLKLRVNLLLAFAERRPRRHSTDGQVTIPIAFALLLIAMLLPHQTGTQALDTLHVGIEQLFTAWH